MTYDEWLESLQEQDPRAAIDAAWREHADAAWREHADAAWREYADAAMEAPLTRGRDGAEP